MRSGRTPGLLSVLGALLALTACAPLYLPPVPATIEAEARLALERSSRLWWDDDRLRLDLVFAEIPHAGWLAVQWLTPAGLEVASVSIWVTPADVGSRRSLVAPPELTRTPGRWQALVSFASSVVRQVSSAEDGP